MLTKKIFPKIFTLLILTAVFSPTYSFELINKSFGSTVFPKILVYLFDFVTLLFILSSTAFFCVNRKALQLLKNFLNRNRFFIFCASIFALLPSLSAGWSGDPEISFITGARFFLISVAILTVIFLTSHSFFFYRIFFLTIVFSAITQSFFAIGQFWSGGSLGFNLLGESYLGGEVLGLARIYLGENLFLRAYGTLPHPNVLGGFQLFAFSVVLYDFLKNKKIFSSKTYPLIFFSFLPGLILSFSRSATVGLLLMLAGTILFVKKKNFWIKSGFGIMVSILLIPLLFVIFAFSSRGLVDGSIWKSESVVLRAELIKANWERLVSQPIFGRGWGAGPGELSAFSDFPFYFFEKQPVHNIFVLVLADLGAIGGILFFLILFWSLVHSFRSNRLIALTTVIFLSIGLLDHYLLTLPIGNFIFFWLVFGFLREEEPRRRKAMR